MLCHARAQRLLSDEHFTIDGTLIEAWAGQKSFKKKGTSSGNSMDDPGNPTVDFKDEKTGKATGSIALQIHSGGGVKIRWRNLKIKNL